MSVEMESGGTDWWRETVVYQIYPRSFFDCNGDGIGDLEGIVAKLDYLVDLGVETLWISPFFASPQADFGYDISDYRDVAPEYGSLQTVDRLIEEAHARGLKIVLDMVLNHTSDQHPWFLASRSSRDDPKRDWYVWRDGRSAGGRAPPNNWRSMLGRRGWHYDAKTDQWYWAQFLPFQPDLNYRNPEVRAEMLDTVRFWLARGVDGFRLDIVNALFEDEEFTDNPFAWRLLPDGDDPSMLFQRLDNTLNHPDTVEFMRVLRETVDAFDERERFLVGEVVAPLSTAKRFLGERADGLNLVFQFQALGVPLEREAVARLLREFETELPDPLLPTWVFSNHDRTRRISRIGGGFEAAKLNTALQLTARGVPFLYNGEEIGMLQARLPVSQTRDAVARPFRRVPQFTVDLARRLTGESLNRDECRTPMQWTSGPTAGFCEGARPWMPLGPEHESRNVETQLADPNSLLHCYRRFLRARREAPALRRGRLELVEGNEPPSVLRYRRVVETVRGPEVALVILNFSARGVLAGPVPAGLSPLVSTHLELPRVGADGVALRAWEGVVFAGPPDS